MSIRGWTYGAVSAASLLAATAYAESGDPAANRPKPATPAVAAVPATRTGPADPEARRALGAAAAAKGKQGNPGDLQDPAAAAARGDGDHGRRGERGNSASAIADHRPGAEQAAGDRVREGRDQGGADGERGHGRRDEVRRERAEELRGRLKSRGIPSPLRAELRTHAKRIAQIERIRTLAAADANLIKRVDAMLVRENERHTRRMTRLVDESNQSPAEAAPTEAAPAADTEPKQPTEEGVTP